MQLETLEAAQPQPRQMGAAAIVINDSISWDPHAHRHHSMGPPRTWSPQQGTHTHIVTTVWPYGTPTHIVTTAWDPHAHHHHSMGRPHTSSPHYGTPTQLYTLQVSATPAATVLQPALLTQSCVPSSIDFPLMAQGQPFSDSTVMCHVTYSYRPIHKI